MGAPAVTVEMYHHVWVIYGFGLSSIVIVFYDWLITLPDEITYVWFGKRNAATYLYLSARYSGAITYAVSAYPLLSSDIPLSTCNALRDFHIYASLTIQALTAAVFILRIYALYNSRKLVIGLISISVSVLVLAILMIALPKHRAPMYALALPGCNALETQAEAVRFAIIWSPVSVFDLVVVGLTARKGWRAYSHSLSRLRYVFMRDGFVYFTVIFIANTGNIITFVVAPPVLKGVSSVLTTALEATLVSRLILNLRVYDAERRREFEEAPSGDATELRIVVHTTTATHGDSQNRDGRYELDSTHATDDRDGHSYAEMEIEEGKAEWEGGSPV